MPAPSKSMYWSDHFHKPWNRLCISSGYFASSQELMSALQLINGNMALSSVAHSIPPQGSSLFPNEHNSIANCPLIGINFQQIVRRLSRRLHGNHPTQFSTHIRDGRKLSEENYKIRTSQFYAMKLAKRTRLLPTQKTWRSCKLCMSN